MLRLFVLVPALCLVNHAALVRVEVAERSDVLGGKSFGKAGSYERLIGKAHFEVDPSHPLNREIVDIEHAAVNGNGLVEFSADLYILKPKELSKANGAILYEPPNRGGKWILRSFHRARGNLDPREEKHFGDNRLFEKGYTLVWLGWQYDVVSGANRIKLYAPAAKLPEGSISGRVRIDFMPARKVSSFNLGARFVPYPVGAGPPVPRLTVRQGMNGKRREIPKERWRVEEDQVVSKDGFLPGKIYEVVYQAVDPAIAELGLAAARDLVSYLKYGGKAATPLRDVSRHLNRAYGFGVSQSAMVLRAFLYEGFNEDEDGRMVLDGVLAHVAGGRRTSLHRFAQPSRTAGPYRNAFSGTDMWPFADLEQTDPVTGESDGLLVRARKRGVVPKIFYSFSSYEYWGTAASLVHTTHDGKDDLPLPDSTRIYIFAGGQHGPAAFPPQGDSGQNLPNPNDYTWSLRALLDAMDRWVRNGDEPPASAYPRVRDGSLVKPQAVRFPKIPGVAFPSHAHRVYRLDFGSRFVEKGIVDREPPAVGRGFATLVPQVDKDGNEIAGIRMPEVEVPLATYTGWNLRAPETGAPQELLNSRGSYIPFAWDAKQRQESGDPRPAILERYRERDDYLRQVKVAAADLVRRGFLVANDVGAIVDRARSHWDWRARHNAVYLGSNRGPDPSQTNRSDKAAAGRRPPKTLVP